MFKRDINVMVGVEVVLLSCQFSCECAGGSWTSYRIPTLN